MQSLQGGNPGGRRCARRAATIIRSTGRITSTSPDVVMKPCCKAAAARDKKQMGCLACIWPKPYRPQPRTVGMSNLVARGITITGPTTPGLQRVLTPQAADFISSLHREFNPTRERLLATRAERRDRIERGERLDFLADTANVRAADW